MREILLDIPDDIFWQAEAAVRQMGISRDEYYERAMEVFLAKNKPNLPNGGATAGSPQQPDA